MQVLRPSRHRWVRRRRPFIVDCQMDAENVWTDKGGLFDAEELELVEDDSEVTT